MAATEKYNCPEKAKCDLTEEEINRYDQTQFMEILEILEDHGIDADKAENFMQAQTLLFEHLQLREEFLGQGEGKGADVVKTDIVQQVVQDHHIRRKHLLGIARKVGTFLNALPANRQKELKRYFPSLDADVKKAVKELEEEKFSFIVAGETGSGKSCFINLLMGHSKQNFLPVSNVPSTSCLCEISYGKEAKVRAYKSGSVEPDEEVALDEKNMTETLSRFTHQKDGRDKAIVYTRVEVDWPLDWLKDGLTIVDSPGVGERREITEMVKQKMPGAYGFIYVINTTKAGGIQEGELEDLLFKQSAAQSNRSDGIQEKRLSDEFDPRTAIFVFNKWDLVENKEKQKIKDFVVAKLKKIFSNIDPETQMFFISTQQATKVLDEKNYVTEDYKKLLRGVERLMEFSMKSKMRKYYHFFAELLSRLAFILKAYISNFGDFQRKYVEVKEKLEKLNTLSKKVRKDIMEMLTVEAQEIVLRLQRHMTSSETKERLCQWHLSECPTHASNVNMLTREAGMRSHERVIGEIKRWEGETRIFQKANTKLMNAFQSEFMSLKHELSFIEADILGPVPDVPDKDLRRLLGDISHSITDDDGAIFDTKEKIAIGITAPLWIPIAIIAAPFVIGWAVREVMREAREEKEYYEGYLNGTSGPLSQLMAEETTKKISNVMEGEGLQGLIQERMHDLVRKMLALINKIPDFVKADQELLYDMRQEYEEGINRDTKDQCIALTRKVSRLQNKLDYFLLACIHEDDIPADGLEMGDLIGEGTFGQVFKCTLTEKDGQKKTVAAKIMKESLTPQNATEVRVEHFNLSKVQSDNTIKYFGLVLFEEDNKSEVPIHIPVMVMEICDGALNEIIYDPDKYIGPGKLKPQDPRRSELLFRMRNFAMQLANGLQHMHKNSLVHRDLKPANILVEKRVGSDNSTQYILKICDFGLTKREDEILNTTCGTPLYMAPEVTDNQMYNKQSDIYSYGLILIELFYGKLVCNLRFVEVRLRPTIFSNDPLSLNSPPVEMQQFMETCWEIDPSKRPSAEKCYKHFKDAERLEIAV